MKLNKKVQVRFSDDDYNQIEQEAKNRGVSVSDVIREKVLQKKNNKIDKDDIHSLIEALAPTLKKLVDYDREKN